jgi:hypothetical protein
MFQCLQRVLVDVSCRWLMVHLSVVKTQYLHRLFNIKVPEINESGPCSSFSLEGMNIDRVDSYV